MSCLLLAMTTLLQPPPQSSRPPVIGYSVLHNASGTLEINAKNSTNFFMTIIPPKVIIFRVSAINVLGNGSENSIISELIFLFYL